MPGPPTGPSPRITTTSPGLIFRAWIAAKQASSPSKTFAGPVMLRCFSPATLATAPSGARLPCRMTMMPWSNIGFSNGQHHALRLGEDARHVGEVLGQRLAGDGEAVAVQQTRVEQRLHHGRRAADAVQVEHDVLAARLQVGEVRHLRAEAVEVGQRPLAPRPRGRWPSGAAPRWSSRPARARRCRRSPATCA